MPIMMLTARRCLLDKIIGLEVARTGTIYRPYDPSRSGAGARHLRRTHEYDAGPQNRTKIKLGSVVVDGIHDAVVGGIPVNLTAREFRAAPYAGEGKLGRALSRDGALRRSGATMRSLASRRWPFLCDAAPVK